MKLKRFFRFVYIDEVLLKAIKAYFGGVGNIYLKGDAIQFKVQSIKYFEKIIAHFEQNPLITVKIVSYQLFKQGVEMIKRKEHLTTEGLNKLISIKASINRGLFTPQTLIRCVQRHRPKIDNRTLHP